MSTNWSMVRSKPPKAFSRLNSRMGSLAASEAHSLRTCGLGGVHSDHDGCNTYVKQANVSSAATVELRAQQRCTDSSQAGPADNENASATAGLKSHVEYWVANLNQRPAQSCARPSAPPGRTG